MKKQEVFPGKIRNISKNSILATRVIMADNLLKRMQGLLGRADLPWGEALVFHGCQSIHMMFMRFSIDVVFIDKKGAVVGVCQNIAPFSFSPFFFKSACAIELPAGTIQQTQTAVGDLIKIV